MTKYVTIKRRNCDVTVPTGLFAFMDENNLTMQVIKDSKGKVSSLQLGTNGGKTYVSTVKQELGIKKFKNGNPLDFRLSNLVFAEPIEKELRGAK